jgi:transcriptional regulator with XRE-family HTH domain
MEWFSPSYTTKHGRVNTMFNSTIGAPYPGLYSQTMDISHRLDEAMQRRGFESQSALARASGVPQPTINRILKGATQNPDMVTMQRLADALGVTLEALIGPAENLLNSLKKGQSRPLSREAELLIQEVFRLDGQSALARKMFPIVRTMLALAGESSEDKNHAVGAHQLPMEQLREAEKALSMTIEGRNEPEHGRGAKRGR